MEAKTYREDDSWLRRKLGWDIDVHLEPGRISAEVCDLDQGTHDGGAKHREGKEAEADWLSCCHLGEGIKDSVDVCWDSGSDGNENE